MKEKEFKKIFEGIFARECANDPSARHNRQGYWDFYYKLWLSLDYIRELNEKMDAIEKTPMSKRRFILEESDDGHFNIIKNPYNTTGVTKSSHRNNNFCFNCGERMQTHFTFCPKCGKKI